MLVAVQHQVGVDLVGDDLHAVLHADIAHLLELLAGPAAAHGVVGIAEDEVLGAVLGLGLKVLQIHGVIAVFVPLQGADHQLPAGVVHHVGKGVVDGLLNEHLVAGLGEHGQHHTHAGHHTRGKGHLGNVRQPAVALLLPGGDSLKVLGGAPGIAKDTLVGPLLDGFHDAGRRTEVHICDPQRDDVIGAVVQLRFLELSRVVIRTIHDFIKIIRHTVILLII